MTRAAQRPIVFTLALLIAVLANGVLHAAEAPHFSGRKLIDVLESFAIRVCWWSIAPMSCARTCV